MVPGDNTQLVPAQGNCCPADEPLAPCVIRDKTTSQWQNPKLTLNLPASTTAMQLMDMVGQKCQYHTDTFELLLEKVYSGELVIINAYKDETLQELGFNCGGISRNFLIVMDKNGMPPCKFESTPDTSDATKEPATCDSANKPRPFFLEDIQIERASASPTKCSETGSTISGVPLAPPPYSPSSAELSYPYSYSAAVIRHDTGYAGLVNQAMTCYLNSLLQTLYMTPEFRNALYRWEFDGTEEEAIKSIPFQLQKLFLQLQTSNKPAIGTTELTTSFGWDSSEAWQQHDVQELCRVMFDALEQKFNHTDQADLISCLYEGKLKDYVKCLQCSNESAREDTFLDVPLVVRPFGSNQAYGSVEEAVRAFVTPETLEASNQYFCEHCNKKCDAHKGLKFTKFPYLLTLQLKRFDFDPVTMHRIKLNDKVTFPEILNLNEFIKTKIEDGDDADTTDTCSAVDDDTCCQGSCKAGSAISLDGVSDENPDVGDEDDDECIDAVPNGAGSVDNTHEVSANERNLRKSMEKGPYIYELFSIMVHSGSANGGHYYAYIKSFKDGQWYCFNDAQVSRITYDDIRKTYGGGPTRGYYSSAYSSSTNAYMLMYRQIDKERNCEPITPDEFPEHIKLLFQNMQEQEERERQQRELDRCMCKIKLYAYHPLQNRVIEMRLKVHKEDSLQDATATAHKILGLEGVVPLECCRLVKYDEFHDSLECSFEDAEDQTMGELLGGVKSSYKFELLLEIRKPDEEFQIYKPGGTTVKVHIVDLASEEISVPIIVRGHLNQTVEKFKQQIAQALGLALTDMRLVLERYYNDLRLLCEGSKTLKGEGFYRSNKVFIEYKDAADACLPFLQSHLYQVLNRYEHTICIHITLPSTDKETLDRLGIPAGVDGEEEERGPGENCTDTPELSNGLLHTSDLPKNQATASTSGTAQESGDGDGDFGEPSYGGYSSSQAAHSDQSEDSSLTDSERTLVGDELSPRNNSPDPTADDVVPDLQPSDAPVNGNAGKASAGTTVELESLRNSSSSDSPANDSSSDDDKNDFGGSTSNELPGDAKGWATYVDIDQRSVKIDPKDRRNAARKVHSQDKPLRKVDDAGCVPGSSQAAECSWDSGAAEEPAETAQQMEFVKRYFRAWPYTDGETGAKMLRTYLDKRITVGALKKELEPWVGVNGEYFKIFRIYSNNQEFESTRLSENLMSYGEDTRLTVKLGRALRKGEYRVKVFQLLVNESEPCKYLIDWVFAKNMTVLQAKKEILPEIRQKCSLDIPLNRCRLRKKSWKSPGSIYLDHQRFEEDISIFANWEVFLEVLSEPEHITSPSHLAAFTRWWHPSTYKLDPFVEVVLEDVTVDSLKEKLSELSSIPAEDIEFAKGQGTFPSEVSLLSIHTELEWHSTASSLSSWPLYICDGGCILYYRDRNEELKKLTEDEKREMSTKENSRLNLQNTSPRKERGLKIYMDPTPNKVATSSTNATTKSIVPDLD